MSLARSLGEHDLQFSAIEDGAKQKIYPTRRVIKESFSNMSPVDYISILLGRKSFWSLVSKSIKDRYASLLGIGSAHPTATALAAAFPEEWNNFFKFCVVRNPWDKTLSDYYWRRKLRSTPPSFEEYVNAIEHGQSLDGIVPRNHQNWTMYTIDDRIAVDYVVRFENLVNGLKEALANTSLEWDGWLPHAKKGDIPDKKSTSRSYRHHYTHDLAQAVNRIYKKEITEFNYEF